MKKLPDGVIATGWNKWKGISQYSIPEINLSFLIPHLKRVTRGIKWIILRVLRDSMMKNFRENFVHLRLKRNKFSRKFILATF